MPFPFVYTFYSYKGGVGRTMAVLNVAYILASRGRHVLLLDMDLEAPVCLASWKAAASSTCLPATAIRTLESNGGLLNIGILGPSPCVYLPTSADPWITLISPLIATGGSTLLAHVAPNANPTRRTGSILISDRSYSISQEGSGTLPARHHFSYRVSQLAYSRYLHRLVLTSDTPNSLPLFAPLTRADQSLALARPPTSIALRPDGLFAAVGHDAGLSLVNLQTATVEAFLPVPLEVATRSV